MATDAQREELSRLLGEIKDDKTRENIRDAWKFQNLPPVTRPMTIDQLEAATRIVRKANPEAEPETVRVNPEDIVAPKASRGKLTQLNILFDENGFGDREIIHEYCAKVIGKPVASTKDLTTAEVNHVIDQLKADAEN
jgi:hypothetical protein